MAVVERAASLGIVVPVVAAAELVAVLDRLALERQNLTAIDGLPDGIERHLLDSLAGLRDPDVASAPALVDVGSGAGFPGLALAVARPSLRVTLIESEGRKADWLVRASARFPNVCVVADRSEHVAGQQRERWPVVTARALGPPAVALELAAPLTAVGGAVVLWRGRRDDDVEDDAVRVAHALGLRPERDLEVTPFPGAERRIQAFRKVGATPSRFPRRPGRAAKRPL